jgi:hypothetical protein
MCSSDLKGVLDGRASFLAKDSLEWTFVGRGNVEEPLVIGREKLIERLQPCGGALSPTVKSLAGPGRNGEKPRGRRREAPIVFPAAECAQKCLLHEVFRVLAAPAHPKTQPKNPVSIGVEQAGDGSVSGLVGCWSDAVSHGAEFYTSL